MESLSTIIGTMRKIAQHPLKDAPKDLVRDWTVDQYRRTFGFIGSGGEAFQARFNLNRALMAGAHAPEKEAKVLTLREGKKSWVEYQGPSALPIEVGVSANWQEAFSPIINVPFPEFVPDVQSILDQMDSPGAYLLKTALKEGPSREDSWKSMGPKRFDEYLFGLDLRFLHAEIEGLEKMMDQVADLPGHLSHLHRGWGVDQITGGLVEPACTFGWKEFINPFSKETSRKEFRCKETTRHYHSAAKLSEETQPIRWAWFSFDSYSASRPPPVIIKILPDGTDPTTDKVVEWEPRVGLSGKQMIHSEEGANTKFAWTIRLPLAKVVGLPPMSLMALKTPRSLPKVGIRDVMAYCLENGPLLNDRLERLTEEIETPTLVAGKALSLTSVMAKEKAEKTLESVKESLGVIQSIEHVLDQMEQAYQAAPEGSPMKLPIIHDPVRGSKLKLWAKTGQYLNEALVVQLKKLDSDRDLDKITVVVPEPFFNELKEPLPLSAETEKKLLSDIGAVKRGSNLSATTVDRARRDSIVAFNSIASLIGKAPVPLHKALNPKDPAAAGKAKAISNKANENSQVETLRTQLINQGKKMDSLAAANAAAMQSVADAMAALAAKVNTGFTDKTPGLETIKGLIAETLGEVRNAAPQPSSPRESVIPPPPPAFPQDFEGEPVEEDDEDEDGAFGLFGDEHELLDEELPEEEHEVLVRNGVVWPLFDPHLVAEGIPLIVVRASHNGKLYCYPQPVSLPSGDEVIEDGLLQFKTEKKPPTAQAAPDKGKGKAKTPPPVPLATKPGAKKEGRPDVSQEGRGMFFCPECSVMRPDPHKAECKFLGEPWLKLSTDGKKERDSWRESGVRPQATKTAGAKSDPLKETDPLETSGKAADLSPDTDKKLRKYFKIKPRADTATLDALSKEERAERINESRLPKWAVRAVLLDESSNLPKILSGTLTKERFSVGDYSRGAKNSQKADMSAAEVGPAWAAIKAQFPGVALLEKPRSNKEKALKKAYTELAKKAGADHPSLPKLKKSDRQSGGSVSSRSRPQTRSNSPIQQFVEMAAAFKAMKDAFT
jgi:hypothetical protein